MFEPASIATSEKTVCDASSVLNESPSQSNGRNYEILRSLPKYNAHCHLGGEIPMDTLMKHASEEQKRGLERAMSEIAPGTDYEKAFVVFPLIAQIINTHAKLREATCRTCERFKEDNNLAVLMRTGLKQLEGKSFEEYLTTVLNGMDDAASEDFKSFLMLSLKRTSTLEVARLTVDLALKYRTRGVIGIDISDISTAGDIRMIIPELLRAKDNGLKLAVHMGESVKEQDQMLIIRELKPDLIDHGVNLCEEAKEWVLKQNIPVTVCLTSAIATRMHDPSVHHPWIMEYLKTGHPIDLGTDDSTVFGNLYLTGEYLRLCPDIEFEKIVQIARASFERAQSFLALPPFSDSRS